MSDGFAPSGLAPIICSASDEVASWPSNHVLKNSKRGNMVLVSLAHQSRPPTEASQYSLLFSDLFSPHSLSPRAVLPWALWVRSGRSRAFSQGLDQTLARTEPLRRTPFHLLGSPWRRTPRQL